MADEKKTTWGGPRIGAGRKGRGIETVHRAFRLRKEDAEEIKGMAEALGVSQADVIHELLKHYQG